MPSIKGTRDGGTAHISEKCGGKRGPAEDPGSSHSGRTEDTMTDAGSGRGKEKRKSIFLSEVFMAVACVAVIVSGIFTLVLCIRQNDAYAIFDLLVKLAASAAMYQAFRFFKWDVAKGLMGLALCGIMYHEAYQVLIRLWGEQNYDTYLVAGVAGSLYLAAAGMALLMTVIITINHFFINYSTRSNPKNIILNRIAILFKLIVYIMLFVSNSRLDFSHAFLLKNGMQFMTDLLLLVLVMSIETQFDSFNALREELRLAKRKGGTKG